MNTSATGLLVSLIRAGIIQDGELGLLQERARNERKTLVTYLVDNDVISSSQLAELCEHEYGIPLLDLDAFELTEIPQKYLNVKLIEKHHALPIYTQGNTLYIAVSDPTNVAALEDFGFTFSLHTEALLVDERKLQKAIQKVADPTGDSFSKSIDDASIGDLEVGDVDAGLNETAETNSDDDAPIVKYINKILVDAVRRGASDLHFEPYEKKYRIRFRVDGLLYEIATPPVNLANRFSARLPSAACHRMAESSSNCHATNPSTCVSALCQRCGVRKLCYVFSTHLPPA
jgi:type IV pilus assembly protein PilB